MPEDVTWKKEKQLICSISAATSCWLGLSYSKKDHCTYVLTFMALSDISPRRSSNFGCTTSIEVSWKTRTEDNLKFGAFTILDLKFQINKAVFISGELALLLMKQENYQVWKSIVCTEVFF